MASFGLMMGGGNRAYQVTEMLVRILELPVSDQHLLHSPVIWDRLFTEKDIIV